MKKQKSDVTKAAPFKISQALTQITSRVGLLGILLTLITSFSLPGAITTAINRDFSLTENGTAIIIQNILLTAPLTIGLTLIFLALIKDWFDNVIVLYLYCTAVLVASSMLFSETGRAVIKFAWQESYGNLLFSFPENIVRAYYEVYFWTPFLGAAITAGFLVWALLKLGKVNKWDA